MEMVFDLVLASKLLPDVIPVDRHCAIAATSKAGMRCLMRYLDLFWAELFGRLPGTPE